MSCASSPRANNASSSMSMDPQKILKSPASRSGIVALLSETGSGSGDQLSVGRHENIDLQRFGGIVAVRVEVGDAFLAQPSAVMDTVQQLRIKAQENGVLESNTQQTVTSDGNIVIIQPYVADVVYVPYYDPGIVYGIWWWPNQPPVSWNPPPRYRPNAYGNIGSGGIAYGGRVVVSPAIFPRYRPNWNGHTISVGGNLRKGASQAVWQHDPAHRQGVAYRTTPSINRVATPSGTQAVVSQQRFAPERQVQQSQQAQQLQQAQPARPQNQSEFIVRQAPSPQPQRVEAPRIAAPQATSQPEPPHTSAPAAPHNETKQSNDPRKPAN